MGDSEPKRSEHHRVTRGLFQNHDAGEPLDLQTGWSERNRRHTPPTASERKDITTDPADSKGRERDECCVLPLVTEKKQKILKRCEALSSLPKTENTNGLNLSKKPTV